VLLLPTILGHNICTYLITNLYTLTKSYVVVVKISNEKFALSSILGVVLIAYNSRTYAYWTNAPFVVVLYCGSRTIVTDVL